MEDGLAIGAALLILAVFLAITILIIWLIYSAQKVIPPQHRRIEPGMVWLLLIPLFNLVWNFFVFLRVPESYQSYFASIGRHDVGDCGRNLGLWYAICAVCSIIPFIGTIAGVASLVLLILFLVKITGLKKQVGAAAPGGFPVGYTAPPPPPQG